MYALDWIFATSENGDVKKLQVLFWSLIVFCVGSFLTSITGFGYMILHLGNQPFSEHSFHASFGMLYVVCGWISPAVYIISALVCTIIVEGYVKDIKNRDRLQCPESLIHLKRHQSQLERITCYLILFVYTFVFGTNLSNITMMVIYVIEVILYIGCVIMYVARYISLLDGLHNYYISMSPYPERLPIDDDLELH
jgi:hypothetical protein